jgi:hypothetical protein
MNSMKRAQMELDFSPENIGITISTRFLTDINRRSMCAFSHPASASVFLPYTEEMYAKTQARIHERGLFEGQTPTVDYAASVAA